MAITLNDFLNPLKTINTQIIIKNLQLENICKIYADSISSIDSKLSARTVNSWDIIRNNLIYVYLNDEETPSGDIPVTGVGLSNTTLELEIGNSATLIATVMPLDATNQNISWLSSDESIVTVDNGVVTAVSQGNATVVVTTEDGSYSATCEITVSEAIIHVESVSIVEEFILIEVGQEPMQLTVEVTPSNATDSSVTWTSGDETIATVENGIVTPIAEGTTTIVVTTVDGGYTDTCEVYVSIPVVNVDSVELNLSEINIVLGNTDFPNLEATVSPSDATYSEIIWTSSDETVVTVDNGVLTPITEGTANIIATVNGIESQPCVVTITTE